MKMRIFMLHEISVRLNLQGSESVPTMLPKTLLTPGNTSRTLHFVHPLHPAPPPPPLTQDFFVIQKVTGMLGIVACTDPRTADGYP